LPWGFFFPASSRHFAFFFFLENKSRGGPGKKRKKKRGSHAPTIGFPLGFFSGGGQGGGSWWGGWVQRFRRPSPVGAGAKGEVFWPAEGRNFFSPEGAIFVFFFAFARKKNGLVFRPDTGARGKQPVVSFFWLGKGGRFGGGINTGGGRLWAGRGVSFTWKIRGKVTPFFPRNETVFFLGRRFGRKLLTRSFRAAGLPGKNPNAPRRWGLREVWRVSLFFKGWRIDPHPKCCRKAEFYFGGGRGIFWWGMGFRGLAHKKVPVGWGKKKTGFFAVGQGETKIFGGRARPNFSPPKICLKTRAGRHQAEEQKKKGLGGGVIQKKVWPGFFLNRGPGGEASPGERGGPKNRAQLFFAGRAVGAGLAEKNGKKNRIGPGREFFGETFVAHVPPQRPPVAASCRNKKMF